MKPTYWLELFEINDEIIILKYDLVFHMWQKYTYF